MDLVEDFVRATEPLGVSEPFRRWGGMLLTSCLLSRDVYTSVSEDRPLYPHLYVVFVAPSGYGKSGVMDAVRACVQPATRAPEHGKAQVALCPSQTTIQYLMSELGHAFPDPSTERPRAKCLAIIADEIGEFFGELITKTQSTTLTSLWDCKEDMLVRRGTVTGARERDMPAIYCPYMTGGWGAQQWWLASAFKTETFNIGFPGRSIFVLSEQPVPKRLSRGTGTEKFNDRLLDGLEGALAAVPKATGRFDWDQDAWAAFDAWVVEGEPGADGRKVVWSQSLDQYAQRRLQHLAKLSLVLACARHPTVNHIHLADFTDAQRMMLEAERDLPNILSLIGANPDIVAEDAVLAWTRDKGEVSEAELRLQLKMRARGTSLVRAMLDEMIAAGQLAVVDETTAAPHRRFRAAG